MAHLTLWLFRQTCPPPGPENRPLAWLAEHLGPRGYDLPRIIQKGYMKSSGRHSLNGPQRMVKWKCKRGRSVTTTRIKKWEGVLPSPPNPMALNPVSLLSHISPRETLGHLTSRTLLASPKATVHLQQNNITLFSWIFPALNPRCNFFLSILGPHIWRIGKAKKLWQGKISESEHHRASFSTKIKHKKIEN